MDLLKFGGKVVIALFVIGLIYYGINQTIMPLPPTLQKLFNVLLIVAVIVGVIVFVLIPLVQ